MRKPFYLTTAIAYANAGPHIGHALELLYGDVMARYQRLLGNEVLFLTGTDEHGQKVLKTAREQGKEVEVFASEKSALFQKLADEWNISNDDFIRTTEERHIKAAQKFWLSAQENGDIYKKSYTGLYCVGCERFITEKDLVEGKCPDHLKEPETVTEENYFFRLSRYEEPLKFLFKERPDFVYPKTRYNEMLNLLNEGLEDISISRVKEKLPCGIAVPGDENQVMYVWFDALINYISALGYASENDQNISKFWPGINMVGKEINRFHSLLWPAMLMSAQLDPPAQIAVHGWMTVNGQKMSKTIGNVIDPLELVEKYPLEAVRYFLMREIPFDNDGDFSHQKFMERYTADLANGLGNLTNRILTMIEKYCDNVVPEVHTVDNAMIDLLTQKIWPAYVQEMERWRFDLALEQAWKFITYCDQLISDKKPWELIKAEQIEKVSDLLHHLAEALRHVAIMIWPVIPETAEKIFTKLGLNVSVELSKPLADLQQWVELTVGNKIDKAEQLFPRIE